MWMIVLGGLIVFLALGFYGRWLEKKPERTAAGREMAERYEKAQTEEVKKRVEKIYDTAYQEGLTSGRAARNVADETPTQPIPVQEAE